MKILHINTLDRGGAALACKRLNDELNKQGVESKMLILQATKKLSNVEIYNYWEGVDSRYKSLKKSIIKALDERYQRHLSKSLPPYPGIFSFPKTIYDVTETNSYKEADIIQLNWTSSFLDEPSFFSKIDKPVIWRMADLYIIGGGPHYENGFPYKNFEKIIDKNIDIRKKALSKKDLNLTIVPISQWCMDKANESSLVQRFDKRIITCGIEVQEYKPFNKKICRQLLNIDENKKVILFGIDSFIEERKGVKIFERVVNKLDNENVQILTFGLGKIELENAINLGFVQDLRLMKIIFSASDLFVTSALEEAFGQTSIEAMASGLPLVSFPTGGALEIFKNSGSLKIGNIASNFSDSALFDAITETLDTQYDSQIIIDYIDKNFNIKTKASEYINLYQSLL